MLIGMIKTSAQSLIYMMTGVRPWTKDGAITLISNTAQGDTFSGSELSRSLNDLQRTMENQKRR
jgi:hypothetical protein